MNGLVKRSVEAVFVQDSFSTLEDYYYLHQMLMSASEYGEIEHGVSAERTLIAKAKSSWLPKLMDFDLSTQAQVSEILVTLSSVPELQEQTDKKLDKLFKNLVKNNLYQGQTQDFFLSLDRKSILETNMHFAKTLTKSA